MQENNRSIVELPGANVDVRPLIENTRWYITASFHTVFQNGPGDSYGGYYVRLDYEERSVYYASRRSECAASYDVRY